MIQKAVAAIIASLGALAFGWVDWFPFGWYGVAFTVGLILGAWLGRAAVAMLIGAFLAVKVGSRHYEGGTPHPDAPPDMGRLKPHRPAKRSAKRPTLRDIFKRRGE